MPERPDPWVGGGHAGQDLPGSIRGAIVYGDHLADLGLLEDVPEDDLQCPLLVEDGHHHRQEGLPAHAPPTLAALPEAVPLLAASRPGRRRPMSALAFGTA